MKRKKKFVVWLNNHTDRQDDEWVVVYAKSRKDINMKDVYFDFRRFTPSRVLTAKEFVKEVGFGAK